MSLPLGLRRCADAQTVASGARGRERGVGQRRNPSRQTAAEAAEVGREHDSGSRPGRRGSLPGRLLRWAPADI